MTLWAEDSQGENSAVADPPSATDAEIRAWTVLQGRESSYGNVEGISYHFPTTIPNGKNGLQEGDVVVCVRPASEAGPDGGRIFGIGRIGWRMEGASEADVFYDRYSAIEPPVRFGDVGGDQRNNKTNAIVIAPPEFVQAVLEVIGLESIAHAPVPQPVLPIASSNFDAILEAAAVDLGETPSPTLASIDDLTVELIEQVLAERGLRFDGTNVVREAVVALRSGKHLLLQGAPGTGKTSLAEAIAEAATRAGIALGADELTGSSDWTPSDTVGTYRLNRHKDLEFSRGQILDAIAGDRWVIIDELNRADIDRAMGPLFSVLSGQSTVLRFEEERDGSFARVAIEPEAAPPSEHASYRVRSTWRILATMNTKDLDLLFEVSQAFLRRFALVDVSSPDRETHLQLLSQFATQVPEVDAIVRRLVSIPSVELGPAITLDCARFVQTQWDLDENTRPTPAELADQAFRLYVRPQLGGLDGTGHRAVLEYLSGGASTAEVTSDSNPVGDADVGGGRGAPIDEAEGDSSDPVATADEGDGAV